MIREHRIKGSAMMLIIVLISIIYIGTSYAAVFNVYTVVCSPDWYCTVYDNEDCGTRSCVDVNGCGTNIGKPAEYLECEEQPSGGGGSGGGSGHTSTVPIIGLPPSGYFTLSTDNIRVTIEQGIVVQKIISVNSSISTRYNLEIQYPSAYTKGTDFITTTADTKIIEKNGDFNIIIDSRDILIDTYVIPVRIYNENHSKTIVLTIDVIPATDTEMDIRLDSKVKNLGMDKEILTFIKTKGLETDINTTLTYSILDPLGNIILSEEITVNDPSDVEHKVPIPADIGEGYYALSVKMTQKEDTYVKSEQFILLTPNKYLPLVESPRRNLTLWIWIIIIIAAVVTLFNTGLFYKSYAPTRHKIVRSMNRWKFTHTPSLSIGEKFTALFKRKPAEEKVLDIKSRMDRLKESYEGGFISAKEYKDISKRYGYNIGIITDTKLTDKEAIETVMNKKYEEEKKEDNNIPITLSNSVNIPIEKEPDKTTDIVETLKEAPKHKAPEKEQAPVIEEKRSILDPSETERPMASESVGGAISHLFAQSIIDKKAHHDQAFVMNDNEGTHRLYSIRDLLNALQDMPAQTFEHHTQHGRNDFANWIGDVFQYYDIAEEIRNVRTRDELIEKLKRY